MSIDPWPKIEPIFEAMPEDVLNLIVQELGAIAPPITLQKTKECARDVLNFYSLFPQVKETALATLGKLKKQAIKTQKCGDTIYLEDFQISHSVANMRNLLILKHKEIYKYTTVEIDRFTVFLFVFQKYSWEDVTITTEDGESILKRPGSLLLDFFRPARELHKSLIKYLLPSRANIEPGESTEENPRRILSITFPPGTCDSDIDDQEPDLNLLEEMERLLTSTNFGGPTPES